MDTELARTFLKVVEVGSFFKAAEQLFVTQAAVSRRIKVLENDLGSILFVRNKAGAILTVSGRRFAKHAAKLVHTLEQARHEIGVSQPYNRYLAIGGRLGLWQGFLLNMIPIMQAKAPDVVLRTQVGFEADLMQQLVDGSLDIAVMYTPQRRPGFEVEPLFEEELLLVTSDPNGVALPDSYVQVEWGPEFLNRNRLDQPELGNPGLIAGVGWLALSHILIHGGSVYLPERLARPYLNSEQLYRVSGSQQFKLPAYMVYANDHDHELFDLAHSSIHQAIAEIELSRA
jgi:DNA-binding transcriptional LysR family regulator